MSVLRSFAKRVLPSSLLYVWRDLKYTDIPDSRDEGDRSSKRFNIVRSHFLPKKTIYFYPQRPLPGTNPYDGSVSHRGAVAYKLCRLLGHGMTTNAPQRYESSPPNRYDVVFNYDRATFLSPLPANQFEVERVVNGRCIDVSKRAVNATFKEVFGYAVGVDPTTYDGRLVVKSNINAAHDGQLRQGPLSPEEVHSNNAYQRVIDNRVDDGAFVLDYRVPVYGDHIPLVYLKHRPTETRFDSKSAHTDFEAPGEIFSERELDKIRQFAQHMGIDYGEFDVLRDREDGRIYVVDANPTPWGPPRGLSDAERKRALTRLGRSFDRLIHEFSRQ